LIEYFDIYGKRIYGHNKLVKSEKVDGMKTGYTRASGYNIVTNVKYDKKHIIIVVMGSNSSSKRDTLASRLMGQKLQYASQQDRYTQKLYDLAPVSIFGDTTEDGKIVPPKNPFRFPDESSSLDPEKSPDFSFFSNINQNSKSAFVLEQKK
jgi:D-alanyl-D-alanine carboxypeptidase